jgi:replication factor C small subunit
MMKEIWVEKYRPNELIDVIGQQTITDEMKPILDGEAPMQHYLFHSVEPGSGKTTLARVMAHQLGYQLHEFNASSKRQRGIAFVEEDVMPLSRIGQYETLFLLDEADRITPQAQDALKGVIENAQGYFILTCNDLNKVSPWLKSRCQVRTFSPIDDEAVFERLKHICVQEAVEMTPDELNIIVKRHKGDMRNAISALQAASYMTGTVRQSFLLSINHSDVDSAKLLKLCFKDNDVTNAVKLMGADIKNAIDVVFDFAVNGKASSENKMKVIEAAIVSRRDLINGVPKEYVAHNFCRMLGI